jgi:hypothetical protein
MFKHLFSYNIKMHIRKKETVFWTLLIPIILATFIYITFEKETEESSSHQIRVGLVSEVANSDFEKVLTQNTSLFTVTRTNRENAEIMLSNKEIAGYYLLEQTPVLVVNESTYVQMRMKIFLDIYLQSGANISFTNLEIVEDNISRAIIPYYILIGIACMGAIFPGISLLHKVKNGKTAIAIRGNIGSVSPYKLFLIGFLANIIIQNVLLLLLVSYITIFLGIHLSNNMPMLFALCFIGNILGILLGSLLGLLYSSFQVESRGKM